MPRTRPTRWPGVRTAALALVVGTASIGGSSLPALAQEPATASEPAEPTTPEADDTTVVLEPAEDGEPAEEAAPAAPSEPAAQAGPAQPVEALERVEGADRIGTSIAVAQDRYPDGQRAVVLASAEDFADALAGAALADYVDGPLLLTGQERLDARVAEELTTRLARGSTVWLLGGPAALSDGVAGAVADLGFTVERLQGPDRYGTAAAIVREITSGGGVSARDLIVATGTDFADGASASGFASKTRPLLFTRGDQLPKATAEEIARLAGAGEGAAEPVEVTAVGGAAAKALTRPGAALPEEVAVTPVVGQDRYETSADLLALMREQVDESTAGQASGPVTLASGVDYPDALVGGTYGRPVLLTQPDELPPAVLEALRAAHGEILGVLVVGGTTSVSEDTAQDAEDTSAGETPAPEPSDESSDEPSDRPTSEGSEPSDEPTSEGSTEPEPSTSTEEDEDSTDADSTDADEQPAAEGEESEQPAAEGEESDESAPRSEEPADAPVAAAAAPTGSASTSTMDAEWRAVKATNSEARVKAFFDKYVNPDPVVKRTVTKDVTIDSQAEADAARNTKFTGTVTITGGVQVRDAVFEGGFLHVIDADLTDVLIDGKDQTRKAWSADFRGRSTLTRVEFRRMQDAVKIDRERSKVVARYVMIHEASREVGNLKGNNTHQDGAQVQAGSFDFQKGYLDYTGNHSGGQGMIFGGDSGAMGALVVKDSFLKSDRNMLTFQRRRSDGFPTSIDFGSVAKGDHNLVAPGPKMNNALSMYINAPTKMTKADQADITEHDFKATNGKTLKWKNGIRRENLS